MDAPMPPVVDTLVTRKSLEEILRSVLQDVVSNDTVIRMVNVAVDTRTENMRTLISGIDAANRDIYRQFEMSARETRESNAAVQKTMTEISTTLARVQTSQEDDRKRISDVFKRVETHDSELDKIKDQLARIENQQSELRVDVHGDPNQALRPSIHGLLTAMSTKLDDRFSGIESNMKEIKDELKTHGAYIERRKAFEAFIWSWGVKLWSNKVYRYGLYITGASVLGILGLNTPAGIDFITRLVHAFLSSK